MKKALSRYHTFELILYPDNLVHLTLIDFIRSQFRYALILHNQDKKEDGSFKKEHWHVLIYYENAKTESAVRRYFLDNQLIDNPTLINYKNDLKEAVRYLIHVENNDKHKYSIEEIESNFEIGSYFNNLISNETLDIQFIRQIIYSYNEPLSKSRLFDEILDNNLWATYRRSYSIIKDILEEHNTLYINKNNID